jgi:hypothetical protein
MGFFGALKNGASNLFGAIKNTASNIYGAVKKGKEFMDKIGYDPENLAYDLSKWSRGEMTVPNGYRYTGPFNPINNGKPKNETDRAGFVHDLEYGAIRRAIDNKTLKHKDEVRRAVKDADNRFYDILNNAPEYTNPNAKPIDRFSNRLGYYGIKLKELGQDIGLIKPDAFVA